jgi:hypothetical protein
MFLEHGRSVMLSEDTYQNKYARLVFFLNEALVWPIDMGNKKSIFHCLDLTSFYTAETQLFLFFFNDSHRSELSK